MFTGIVEALGTIVSVSELDDTKTGGGGFAVTIGDASTVLADVALGDSISVNGMISLFIAKLLHINIHI